MKTRQIRDWAFNLHRYLGLAIGLIIVIIGLTGTLLVFRVEIDQFLVNQQFGSITPQGEKASLTTIVNSVKTVYRNQPDVKIPSVNLSQAPSLPYRVWAVSPEAKYTEVFVNPYTGKVLGSRPWENTFFGWVYRLHYELLAGEIGLIIVGIVALFWVILSITGIILWPGWRRLMTGFKIKWQAHRQRVSFDVHKVTGIIVAAFLAIIAFTGFCWNFHDQTESLIYRATFTPKPPEPTSSVIANRLPLTIDQLVQKSTTVLPDAKLESIYLPLTPEGAFWVRKKFPESLNNYGMSYIYLDQYNGKVLQVKNELSPSRADAVLNSFLPLHYGTFWGFPSRLFYLFVGIAPTILLITGLIMWWHRRQRDIKKIRVQTEIQTH